MTMEWRQSLLLLMSRVDAKPRTILTPGIFALFGLEIPESASTSSGQLGQDLLHLGRGESA